MTRTSIELNIEDTCKNAVNMTNEGNIVVEAAGNEQFLFYRNRWNEPKMKIVTNE